MKDNSRLAKRHLRAIHACEKGALGVHCGHRWMATLLYRDIIPQLAETHADERERFALFATLMRKRDIRKMIFPTMLWCAGGIVYGIFTALGGRRAIWKSAAVIKGIVERKLLDAGEFFKDRDHGIRDAIHRLHYDEMQSPDIY